MATMIWNDVMWEVGFLKSVVNGCSCELLYLHCFNAVLMH